MTAPDYKTYGLEFDATLHEYYYHGHRVPNVSNVLSYAGLYDYLSSGAIREEVLEHARQRGAKVHDAIDAYHNDDGDLFIDDAEADTYLQGYRNFLAHTGYRNVHTELRLCCSVCGHHPVFAGTLDSWGYLGGEPALIDIKTTSQVHEDAVGWQLAAYEHLLIRANGIDSSGHESSNNNFVVGGTRETRASLQKYVLHIHPRHAVGYSLIPVDENAWPEFAVALYDLVHGDEGPYKPLSLS